MQGVVLQASRGRGAGRAVRRWCGTRVHRLQQGRHSVALPDDRWLVSYPKSGNTWIRFMMASAMFPGARIDFSTLDSIAPDIYGMPSYRQLRAPRPRLMKSHEVFDLQYGRVIYLVRDPRDVCVSMCHYLRKRRKVPDDLKADEFVGTFLAVGKGVFGTWGQHVGSWLGGSRGDDRFLLMRYEDCLADPVHELRRGCDHFGIRLDDENLERISDGYTMTRMRELEQTTWRDSSRLAPGARTDIPFVREGRSNQWSEELGSLSVARIEACYGELMTTLGYLP